MCNRYPREAVTPRRPYHELRLEGGHSQDRIGGRRRCRITHIRFDRTVSGDGVAASAWCTIAWRNIQRSRRSQGGCQVDPLVTDFWTDLERGWQWMVIRHPERGAVRKNAGGAPQGEFADRQHVALDFELDEAPSMAAQGLAARLHVALEIALLLLKVVGLEKQALRPDDLVEF